MPTTTRSIRTALALVLFSLPGSAQERALDDAALEPVAEALADHFEARQATIGIEKAQAALAAEVLALRDSADGPDLLALPVDLARAVWLARGYSKKKGKQGKVVTDRYAGGSFGERGLEYAFRLPKDYDPKRAAYPLILAIPDVEETPAEHLRTHWSLRAIQDEAIVVCPEMPTDREEWAQVMVAGRPGGLCHVLTALRMAGEEFAIDFDRVYIAGRGKGVAAAVAAGDYSPQRFAGVIGRAGDTEAGTGPGNFTSLPTFFAGAGANARAFAEGAASLNCELAPGGKEQDIWSWILGHPRTAWPESVSLFVGNPFPTRAYWLRVAPTAPDATATATIDRETNTIRINSQGVSFATVYLCDALVDLGRPVTVRCNGVESTVQVERRLTTALDLLADGTSDAAAVYVAEAVFDMSGVQPVSVTSTSDADAEYEERLIAALGKPTELWDLYLWCASTQRAAQGGLVLQRLLRLDPDHADARRTLGHERSGEHWFRSREALARYERGQDEVLATAKGHVKHKSVWMHRDERALANKGHVKDPKTGQWLTKADRKKLAQGWVLQDFEWISPEETANVDESRWHVDGEWLGLAMANRRHAGLDTMWRIPGAEVLLYSSADRDVALQAVTHMERAIDDLRRVFGAEPVLPLSVCLVRDEEQFDRLAFGDPDGRRPAAHLGRRQAVHYGYFTESWFPSLNGKREFRGTGVGYWDPLVPYGGLYGVHSARLAAGLSYVDALDPSPKAVRGALADGPGAEYFAEYEAEKQLPAWLRIGGAVYGERYFQDANAAADADAWWARTWSLDNLRGRGGLRDLEEVFAFELDPGDRDDGLKLMIEAGLLVAFMVDGACAAVSEEHEKFKRDLVSGRLHANQVRALQQAIMDHEAELRAFAGL